MLDRSEPSKETGYTGVATLKSEGMCDAFIAFFTLNRCWSLRAPNTPDWETRFWGTVAATNMLRTRIAQEEGLAPARSSAGLPLPPTASVSIHLPEYCT